VTAQAILGYYLQFAQLLHRTSSSKKTFPETSTTLSLPTTASDTSTALKNALKVTKELRDKVHD
jgi:hypothetical protein